jgi:GT2 family glycosyltransferase
LESQLVATPSEPDRVDASVVLCVRNAAEVIDDQLDALSRQRTTRRWELLIVDNGSTDDSMAHVERFRARLPATRIVAANERAGLSYARNIGAAAAAGRLVAFCDADDAARPEWLDALCAAHRPRTIVGGRLDFTRYNDETVRYWRGLGDRTEDLWLGFDHLPHVIGANFAIGRDDFAELGGCDEQFTGSSDEMDLCWRAQNAGFAIVFAPEAVIDYRLRSSIKETRDQQRGYGRSAVALFAKHRDRLARRTPRDVVAPYLQLLVDVHQLARGRRLRGRWLSNAAYRSGRLRGSFEQRTWFP